MKSIAFAFTLGCISNLHLYSQNVGINTAAPTRGKFEVAGAVGSTVAIISQGAGTGISFQRNYPGIGFNQYYTDQSRYIVSGKASVFWLDMNTGYLNFDVFPTGSTNLPALNPARVAQIQQNGNVALYYAGQVNASLFVVPTAAFYVTRFRGTTYHSEFNNFSGSDYWTTINAGKAGGDVYINDAASGYIYLNGRTTVNEYIQTNAALHIKQLDGRGLVIVEPSTFHNWEFVTTKNLTEPNSDYYTYYNGAYKGNFFHIDGDYYPISDQRLKKNITGLTGTLDKVMMIAPKLYHMKNFETAATKTLGFLAQDVQKVFPELVEQVGEGNTGYPGINELYSMNYNALTPVAIQALKEQQQKVAELKTRNENLRKKIEALEKLSN